MSALDIRRIRYFLLLCDTLNFSETAKKLGLSQPALTKAIKKLEEEIGGSLIRREGKNTHLTHLGRLMFEQLLKIDEVTRLAELTAQRLVHGDMPQIQIAVMCTIGPRQVQAFLKLWRAANPRVEIVLRNADRTSIGEMLLNGFVDCALVGAVARDEPNLKSIKLYKEPMVVACASDHAFAAKKSVSLEEVMEEPYLDRLNCEFRDTFLSESENLGVTINFAVRSEREDWIQVLVRAGLGVTILPRESVTIEDMITRPINLGKLERTVSLAVPFGREDTPLLRKFFSAARQFNWSNADS